NRTCAGPPTRNQVRSASDWFASSRPRSDGIADLREGAMSAKGTASPRMLHVPSPLAGEGWGGGWRLAHEPMATPPPSPPPQGGREFACVCDSLRGHYFSAASSPGSA